MKVIIKEIHVTTTSTSKKKQKKKKQTNKQTKNKNKKNCKVLYKYFIEVKHTYLSARLENKLVQSIL
jgi:hypothetical protein